MPKLSLRLVGIPLLFLALILNGSAYGPIQHVEASAQFSIDLKASKSMVEPTQLYIYTITVRNTSSTDAIEPLLTLSLDDDTEFESASDNGNERGGSVEWEDFSLSAGESRTFNASVRVDDRAADGDDLYAAAFIGNAFDEVQVEVVSEEDENNDDERAITVELFSNKPQVEPTEPFSFIVRVKNTGTNKVAGAEVTLELAEGIEFLSAGNKGNNTGQNIVWTDIDLKGGETRTFTASVRVASNISHLDSLTSIVYTEGYVHEHKINVWDRHEGSENMEVHAFTNDDDIEAGESLKYTLRIKNLADQEERINIKAHIDPKTIFASASENGIQYDRTVIQWDDVSFKQSQTKSFTVTVDVKEDAPVGSQIRFSAIAGIGRKEVSTTVKQSASSGAVTNGGGGFLNSLPRLQGSASTQNSIATNSSVTITQSADKAEVQPGSVISYSVAVHNSGTETLENIQVTEQFPESQLSVRSVEKGTANGNVVTWNIPSLGSGETWNAGYSAEVESSTTHGTVIRKNASVLSDGVLIAQTSNNTAVISQLPQAGFGTFSLALKESEYVLRPKKVHAAGTVSLVEIAPKVQERSSKLLWILLSVMGIASGMIFAKKLV